MIPFLDSPRALAELLIWCWCLTLWIPQDTTNKNRLIWTLVWTQRQMCDYISSLKRAIWRTTLGRRGSKHVKWRKFKCKKCVNVVFFMILMLSKTVLQADKMETSNKRTFLFFCTAPFPRWQMSQNKTQKDLKKKKHLLYTECPANV